MHSILPSGYLGRSVQLTKEVNAAVKQCQAMPVTISILPLPVEDVRWTAFTDSGLDASKRQRHQQAWLIGVTNSHLNQGRLAPVSILHWRNRKLTRKAGSPQLVETYAASSTIVELAWMKALAESMVWRDCSIMTQRRTSKPLVNEMPHVVLSENSSFDDPKSTLITDSKGLFP